MESATDILYTADATGHFLVYNPTAEVRLGYTSAELVGRHYLDLILPDFRQSVRRFYNRQVALRIPSTYREFPAVAKDGSVVWLGQNVQLVLEGERVVGFHAVARDVSRRKWQEALSRGQRAVLELVARRAPLDVSLNHLCRLVEELQGGWCSILMVRDGKLYNAAAPNVPGFYKARIEGLPIGPGVGSCGSAAYLGRRVVTEDVRIDPYWEGYRELAAQAGIGAAWSTPIHSDGRVVGTFALYYPDPRAPREQDIEVIELCSGLAQIAIERHLEEQRIQALVAQRTAELERAQAQLIRSRQLEGVGRVASGLAHEFNNWLTVIQLYCERLGRDPRAEAIHAADEIREAAQRASVLTRQLLAFGRTQDLRPRVVDLNNLVAGLGAMLRALLGSGVRVLIAGSGSAVPVLVDTAQFEQVLVNLALNARDAMPDGGTFTVGVSVEADRAVVDVADDGSGMDSDTLARVFEPFFTTKAPGRGSGLGLATVYGVVRQSGGEITVWSEPGKGARFRIVLPLATEPLAAVDDERTSIPRGSGEAVLVVDDDPHVRGLVASLLRRLDYEVAEAADGPQAIRLSSERPFRLLLTDIALRGTDGRDLARAICDGGRTDAPRVLYMSGHALSDSCRPCLPKPFSARMLAEGVRLALA